jgi:hypothetical protein
LRRYFHFMDDDVKEEGKFITSKSIRAKSRVGSLAFSPSRLSSSSQFLITSLLINRKSWQRPFGIESATKHTGKHPSERKKWRQIPRAKLFLRSEKFASHLDINKFNVSPVMAPKRPKTFYARKYIKMDAREH